MKPTILSHLIVVPVVSNSVIHIPFTGNISSVIACFYILSAMFLSLLLSRLPRVNLIDCSHTYCLTSCLSLSLVHSIYHPFVCILTLLECGGNERNCNCPYLDELATGRDRHWKGRDVGILWGDSVVNEWRGDRWINEGIFISTLRMYNTGLYWCI